MSQEPKDMNAQPQIDFTAAQSADALPMPRATLEMIDQQRRRALDALLQGFDGLIAGREAAKACAVSFGSEAGLSEEATKALMAGNDKRDRWHVERDGCATWREVFAKETAETINRAVWSHVIQATDLEKLMDRQARDEFRASLSENPPEPTPENVAATLQHYASQAGVIFQRGIANAFSKLDRRFKSHDGFKIGARVILDGYFSEWSGISSRGEETLRDIERVFTVLDGLDQPEGYAGIVGKLRGLRSSERPALVQSEWVRVRVFKNGNAHLWFERDDLVKKVNLLLADYYGEAIGEGSEVCDVSDLGPGYHLTPAKNLGFYETDADTAARLLDRLSVSYLMKEKGARVLEPSAGNGALADEVRRLGGNVQCVELDTGRAAVLRSKGFRVIEGDFLRIEPHQIPGGLFDGVIMNPPFDLGRDCDHVRHALKFLKPGGWLLAIMSARAELSEDKRCASFRAMLAKDCQPSNNWRREFFQDLPAGSFAHAGTNVNTVTLALFKKEA
jgi:predicted RNA methylase